MKVAKESATLLVVKAGLRTRLLLFGFLLLALGLLALVVIRTQPIMPEDLAIPELLRSQQRQAATDDPVQPTSSPSFGSLNLARYVGQLLFTAWRPVIVAGGIAILAGLVIIVGPHYNRGLILDKAAQQVRLKEPRWFFRSRVEHHPFEDVSEVRVERDRSTGRSGDNYGVTLVISHSEGMPLTRDYVHYKTVFEVSESFGYNYQTAQEMVDRIQAFMATG